MGKIIIRLTESELMEMVNESVRMVCSEKYGLTVNETILGDDSNESDEVFNSYEPFGSQMDDDEMDFDPDEPLYMLDARKPINLQLMG